MINRQQLLRITIDEVEKYSMLYHKIYLKHWKKVRTRLFKELMELQVEEYLREDYLD